ncbi:MAG: hypothetical protein JEZ07_13310 [Phycisphaerae bacterium]|nr:hypothetical protein [Phycisphaerae bacterium]
MTVPYFQNSIWQRRFWEHRLRDKEDFSNHLHYIHFNPVKHGYVESPADWPYSTFHRFWKKGIYDDFDWNFLAQIDYNANIEYEK